MYLNRRRKNDRREKNVEKSDENKNNLLHLLYNPQQSEKKDKNERRVLKRRAS